MFNQSLKAAALLLLVAMCLLANLAIAQTQPTVSATATFENIGIEVTFENTVTEGLDISPRFRIAGSESSFASGHKLSQISPEKYAGSIFALDKNTAYEVVLSGSALDIDLELLVTTRSDDFSHTPTAILHVAPGGSDANDGSSRDNSLATLERGLALATAGTKIIMYGGRYFEGDLYTPRSGTAQDPITIESAPGETPIIDGTDPGFDPVWELFDESNGIYRTPSSAQPVNAYLDGEHLFNYLNLQDLVDRTWFMPAGFHADGSHLYVRFPNDDVPDAHTVALPRFSTALHIDHQSHIHLRGLEFAYYGTEQIRQAIYINGGDFNLIEDCNFHHNVVGISLKRTADFNTIQNCTFDDSPLQEWNWNAVKSGGVSYEGGALNVYTSNLPNTGNVFRLNTIRNQFDGSHLYSANLDGPTKNMDFYGNEITECRDDAIETDGAGSNVRIYDNRIVDFLTGISVAPCAIGPTYIMRNILLDWHDVDDFGGYPVKFNVNSSLPIRWVYLYHNTCHTDFPAQNGFLFKNYSDWTDIVSRNNIYSATGYAMESWSSTNPVSFDFDNLHTTDPARFASWARVEARSLEAFQQLSNQEINGSSEDPQFVDSQKGVITLRPTSTMIDAGVLIPGVNDNYIGEAPDVGASEFALSPRDLVITEDGINTGWLVSPGSTYQLLRSTELKSDTWIAIGEMFTAEEKRITLSDPSPPLGGKAFYRLEQQLP
ncbi:MAG: right-handed parallel beta-helix repeat-containing protein [Luteolibacter sp.]